MIIGNEERVKLMLLLTNIHFRPRELMLVADALRLGGAILGSHPDMLAPQLIGRLLPEIGGNVNVKMLLRACDNDGAKNCALLPVYHCLHTPGGPLKVIGRNCPIKRKIKFLYDPLNFSSILWRAINSLYLDFV